MGVRGPVGEPIALRALRGNPGKRSLGKAAAQPRRVAPAKPPGMSRRAKEIWDELEPMLLRLNLLTELDGAYFRDLCEGEAALGRERVRVGKQKQFLTTKTGYQYLNPEYARLDKLEAKVGGLRQRFGLSPSDRARLNIRAPRESPSGVLDDLGKRQRGAAS